MPTPPPGNAVAKRAAGQVRTKEDLLANVESQAEQVLDARGAPRFTGEEKEPRPGMASGHVPGSRNIPSSAFYHADNSMKRGEELRSLFLDAGTDLDRPIFTSCGSGVPSATLLEGLDPRGTTALPLFHGSW